MVAELVRKTFLVDGWQFVVLVAPDAPNKPLQVDVTPLDVPTVAFVPQVDVARELADKLGAQSPAGAMMGAALAELLLANMTPTEERAGRRERIACRAVGAGDGIDGIDGIGVQSITIGGERIFRNPKP